MARTLTPAAALGLALVSASSASSAACGAERVVGVGDRVRHDDFLYSVAGVERAKEIGDRHARGTFHIVTFRVENRAGRVTHEWSNDIAYVVDERGRQFDNDTEAQRALDRHAPFGLSDRYVTRAEMDQTTKLVFDLPDDVKSPYLKFRGFLLMGDVFDGNQYKRTRVKLF
jgi:hypothetical protein